MTDPLKTDSQSDESPLKIVAGATVDPEDVARFAKISKTWWDPTGPFKPLHLLNPTRIRFLKEAITEAFGRDPRDIRALSGLQILDIGCGGGLVSEPMARLGAEVTGVDASAENIAVASLHAREQGLSVTYRASNADVLVTEGAVFDVVLALEIIEHTADPGLFLDMLGKLVKPGGLVIVSTLNRTTKSYLLGIIGAEYVLRWVPRGTHDWKQFIRPSELEDGLRHAGLTLKRLKGLVFDPLRRDWDLSDRDLGVNYFAVARKPE